MNRLYTTFEVRAVDEEKRIIEGIATTSGIALDGMVLETAGIEFKLPIPFLFAHDHRLPLGNVVTADVKTDRVLVRIQVAPAGTADFIDEKWRLIKSGTVRGLSIGWHTLKDKFDATFGGLRILKSRWLELSAVPVPADMNASITHIRAADEAILASLGIQNSADSVKAFDAQSRAVCGQKRKGSVVTLDKTHPSSVLGLPKRNAMTLQEQITQWDAKLVSTREQASLIMDKAATESRVLTQEEQEQYDGLETEIKDITGHMARLRKHEQYVVSKATPVTQENNNNAQNSAATRQGRDPITVRSMAPKGIGVARMAMAIVQGKLTQTSPMEIAKRRWPDNPEVEMLTRSVVEAGDTTTSGWASQLVPAAQQMSGEFLDMLRAKIVMGRIPGLRDVPFNVSVPLQSGGGTYGYVGEGAPKPVTKPTYGSATLRFEKAAGIIVITEELARFSQPSAETLVRDELLKGLTAFFDGVFVGADAAVSNVSPAGIRNGISATAATGTTANYFRSNMNTIIQNMITNNYNPSELAIIMSSGMAMSLASMINSLGQSEFPTINATGGNYLGIPIIDSQAAGTNIILLHPDSILLAEDPAIRIDVSREASVEMDTAPAGGETSPITTISTLKSFWQNNLVGLRVEQFRTWKVARATAVEYISGAAYVPPSS